jgi:hypothetical protein
VDNDTDLREALKIYNYFHQLNRAPEWGEIALRLVTQLHLLASVSAIACASIRCSSCSCSSRMCACLIPGSQLISGKSASPSRELPGAGDFASLSSASATKRASTQRSRSCKAPHPPLLRPAGRIPALQMSSVSLPRSCHPQHRLILAPGQMPGGFLPSPDADCLPF